VGGVGLGRLACGRLLAWDGGACERITHRIGLLVVGHVNSATFKARQCRAGSGWLTPYPVTATSRHCWAAASPVGCVTMNRVVPAPDDRRAFMVIHGKTEQSWVDPHDPLRLEFEYVQRISEVLEETVLLRPPSERVRVIHIGGGGLTLPRFVEARRPRTAQVVLEPDAELTAKVREKLPLTRNSSIKVRPVDGRTGIAALPSGCADSVIIDAFAGASVPPELATLEFFTEVGRTLRPGGQVVMNLTDSAPFGWARRCLAGIVASFEEVAVSAEVPVWKGRRFGNLVAVGGTDLPVAALGRRLQRAGFPYRLLSGRELASWLGGAEAFTDADAEGSPSPAWSRGWFS
jgi:hypothetical protein